MVATSVQGLTYAELALIQRARLVSKKFSAPITSLRRRMGSAWTEAKPTSAAAAVKRGQRPATGRLATDTGSPDTE